MKQHLSILMLAARSTICKILLVFLAMAAAEGTLFYVTLRKALTGEGIGLEQMIVQSRIPLVCGLSFLLLCAILSLSWCEFSGSKLRYTLKRLSVAEVTTVFWWAVYNTICFFVFWAFQLLIVLLLLRLYIATINPIYISEQTAFLAFYRHNFLHSLLPLEEISRYISNALLLLSLGISAACFSFRQRRHQKGIAIIALAALTVGFFPREMGSFINDLMIAIIALSVAAGAVAGVWKERIYEDQT